MRAGQLTTGATAIAGALSHVHRADLDDLDTPAGYSASDDIETWLHEPRPALSSVGAPAAKAPGAPPTTTSSTVLAPVSTTGDDDLDDFFSSL